MRSSACSVSQEHFVSSSSKSPGTVFWTVCLADLDFDSFFSLTNWGSIPPRKHLQSHLLIFFVFSFQGSTLFSLVGRYIVAGFAQRLWEPWACRPRFLSLYWFVFAMVVFFHFVSPRHANEFGSVTACVAVFAGTLELTLAAVFGSGYGLLAPTVCSQVSFPFLCCGYMEILTWFFEHPTWVCRG